ncbi:MAG TPA: uroporphyrinogen-III synthase [Flavobacteriaceae bacterium]|nr:uroporphyrinogen-III synthase [Flavobacteriaceae bacterium]HBR54340.1 uroporphyrinogen-III synthase [Flavobacteriaceae bacterium]
MMAILSTKKLKPNQRDLLLASGNSVVSYDAISIEYIPFDIPQHIQNAIFTSQHAVRSIGDKKWPIDRCFCVGEKTKALLEEKGLKVEEMAENSSELGKIIAKSYEFESFYYFTGNLRREELPTILKDAKIEYFEVKTYKTTLNVRKFEQKWDIVLFFSPSGVQSFTAENSLANTTAMCIGETTAAEAKKYTSEVLVSNTTSVESVIAKTVKTAQTI